MRRALWTVMVMALALLSGCASVMRNEVIAFHDWPTDMQDKSYVFERKPTRENNLEYQRYENLLRGELQRLGFTEAQTPRTANLKVTLDYRIDARDVKVVQPVYADPSWPYYPYYGPRWRGYYGPFYDPFWYAPPVVVGYRENQYQLFQRQLNILITRSKDGKNLFDVTVTSDGTNGSLAFAMPYMIRSALTDFPGKSGVPHQIDIKIKE